MVCAKGCEARKQAEQTRRLCFLKEKQTECICHFLISSTGSWQSLRKEVRSKKYQEEGESDQKVM